MSERHWRGVRSSEGRGEERRRGSDASLSLCCSTKCVNERGGSSNSSYRARDGRGGARRAVRARARALKSFGT